MPRVDLWAKAHGIHTMPRVCKESELKILLTRQQKGRAREMTRSVMHLPRKREDLSSDPGRTCKISVERKGKKDTPPLGRSGRTV